MCWAKLDDRPYASSDPYTVAMDLIYAGKGSGSIMAK